MAESNQRDGTKLVAGWEEVIVQTLVIGLAKDHSRIIMSTISLKVAWVVRISTPFLPSFHFFQFVWVSV